MPEPSRSRLRPIVEPYGRQDHPESLDETVVHDPSGRPWLVCTADLLYGFEGYDGSESPGADEPDEPDDLVGQAAPARGAGAYETQVYYTARAGIRGFPTGHVERYQRRDEALAGHRRWCLDVRLGATCPDQVPDDAE